MGLVGYLKRNLWLRVSTYFWQKGKVKMLQIRFTASGCRNRQTEQTWIQTDVFVADSIEFLTRVKNLGLIVCRSSLIVLTDKQQLTKDINLKAIQSICLWSVAKNAPQLVAPDTHTTGPNFTLPNTNYAHKTSQVIFSEARSILPEDGSQRIRNMSEFLIVF